jgi:hypothetical protein
LTHPHSLGVSRIDLVVGDDQKAPSISDIVAAGGLHHVRPAATEVVVAPCAPPAQHHVLAGRSSRKALREQRAGASGGESARPSPTDGADTTNAAIDQPPAKDGW